MDVLGQQNTEVGEKYVAGINPTNLFEADYNYFILSRAQLRERLSPKHEDRISEQQYGEGVEKLKLEFVDNCLNKIRGLIKSFPANELKKVLYEGQIAYDSTGTLITIKPIMLAFRQFAKRGWGVFSKGVAAEECRVAFIKGLDEIEVTNTKKIELYGEMLSQSLKTVEHLIQDLQQELGKFVTYSKEGIYFEEERLKVTTRLDEHLYAVINKAINAIDTLPIDLEYNACETYVELKALIMQVTAITIWNSVKCQDAVLLAPSELIQNLFEHGHPISKRDELMYLLQILHPASGHSSLCFNGSTPKFEITEVAKKIEA